MRTSQELFKFNRNSMFRSFIALSTALILAACSTPSLTESPSIAEESTQRPESIESADASVVESAPGQGGTLRLFYHQAPTIVNPHLSPGTKDLSASRVVYEPLATFKKDGEMVPILATEIPSIENGQVSPDGRSVTWTLKEDVFWADGEPFTANDVLFTYEYVTNPDVNATSLTAYTDIESIELIDDFTLTIIFKQPTGGWYAPFVGPLGMIIPRHIFDEYNGSNFAEAEANLLATGTGPYFVSEFLEEDILIIGTNAVSTINITYEINPYFRDPDTPSFETVELRGGGDPIVAGQIAKEGLSDYSYSVSLSDEALDAIEEPGKAIVVPAPQSFVERIMLNFTDPDMETGDGERSSLEHPHPFLTDPAVRQAIALGVNREAIAGFWGRVARVTPNILVEPPNVDSPNNSAVYDPEEAIRILDEAGWVDSDNDGIRDKDGVAFSLVFQTSIEPLRQLSQDQVKQDLETIGFEVELKQIEASIFFGPPVNTTDTRRQFYADFEEYAFSNKSPDPTAYMAGWLCSETAQAEDNWSGSNWSRYCNPEYDELFEEVITEIDPEKRDQLFIELNDILVKDNAVIPLAHRDFTNIVSVVLRGYDFTPWDVDTWNIADWYRETE